MNIFLELILMVVVVASCFCLERQSFERRSTVGVQEFYSYAESVKVRFKKGIIKVGEVICGIVGIVLVVSRLI